MNRLLYPFLFCTSFVGTKFVGLERTVRFFESMGKTKIKLDELQKKLPLVNRFSLTPAPLQKLKEDIRSGYERIPLPIECLDQALVTWYLLNLNHHPAVLKIGMRLDPIASHAWVVCGDEILGGIDDLEGMEIMSEYASWVTR